MWAGMGSAGEVPVYLPDGSSSKVEVEYGLESDCRAAWQGEAC